MEEQVSPYILKYGWRREGKGPVVRDAALACRGGEGEKWMALLLAGCQNCKYYFVKCEGMERERGDNLHTMALFPSRGGGVILVS